jgi:hypothetical protein
MSIRFFLILTLFLAQLNQAFATIGYEESTENMIDTNVDISEIEIGSDIIYYDFSAKEYKNAFVELKDDTVSGIRIEVKELETNQKRVFVIDYE